MSLLGQTPLGNNVAMATPKVPGDQKPFERVCHMLKLKVTKFQLPTPNGFRAALKQNSLTVLTTYGCFIIDHQIGLDASGSINFKAS